MVILLGVVFLFSCSRTEPSIPFGFIELTYYPVDGRPQERYTMFVIAEDDDGLENLDELRLYYDREGLEWILDSTDWIHHEESGRHWIGSRSIAMTGGDTLPRGQFRVSLINKGGERTEKTLTFDAPETPRYPYPSLRVADGRYSVSSGYPVNSFIAYDQAGNFLRTISVMGTEGNISSLNIPGSARLLALWAQDSEYRTSALTEAISFR
jgi:hypothetical protein